MKKFIEVERLSGKEVIIYSDAYNIANPNLIYVGQVLRIPTINSYE